MRNISFLIICLFSIFVISCKNRDNKQSNSTSLAETLLAISTEDGSSRGIISEGNAIIGDFHVKYCIEPNEIIADTVIVSETENQVFVNHSIFLTIQYKGQLILDNYEIRSTSFDGIPNPNRFILSPMGSIEFEVTNNELVAKTGMFVIDTDWGYFVTINVTEKGEVCIFAEDSDDLYETE